MIPKPLDKIESSDILALVTNHDEERRTMDFKRDLPGNTDKDKNELRADVTSFANASGGDLIFGVEEAAGVASAVPGLPGIDPDTEIRRIEAVIQSCVDPRVPGCESRAIPIPNKGPAIVVRVPKSWRGPHLVKINDTFRMFGRNSKGKYIFDATEIRSAYSLADELPERIRRWRDDRIARVIGGDPPAPLVDGARWFIHLLPLSSFSGSIQLSAHELVTQRMAFHPIGVNSWNHRVNIDGFMTHNGPLGEGKRNNAYCQVFRSGRVESVSTDVVDGYYSEGRIASAWFEKTTIDILSSYLMGLKNLGVALPIVALIAVYGTKGVRLGVSNRLMRMGSGTIDRDMLNLPDVLIESFTPDMPTLMRPVFEALWNAAGWEQNYHYDENGKWALND